MKTLRLGGGSVTTSFVALLIAVFLGYVNLHNDEVQAPLLVLLLSSFLLGYTRPGQAWVWALIVGLGIPLSSLLALMIGVSYPCRPGHPYSCEPMTTATALSTFVLVVPALLSAYLGVLLRRSTWWRETVET
jgi:hypothetical protein